MDRAALATHAACFAVGWMMHALYRRIFFRVGFSTLAHGTKSGLYSEELKMVLVVNDGLKMGKGKIGAQCAHAAVGLLEEFGDDQPELLQAWASSGQAKICLRGSSTDELRALRTAARRRGLPTYLVRDAGRTQIAAGSRTVLAIGPAAKSDVDTITGHLKLL